MKKITFLLSILGLSIAMSAQTKITFEDAVIGSTGGATAMWGAGTVDVVANTYTTGNPSAKALHVLNTNYLPVYFSNVPLPAGAEALYSKIRVKYLIIGGSDINYPILEIFSAPNSDVSTLPKIGEVAWAGLWGTAEPGVWKTVEFAFANATLKPVPAGNLVLKLSKSSCEYLIDDVELVPIPVATPIITVNDFESNTIGDVLSMRRYGATDASAIVEANPTDAANKAVHILATNWDSGLKQNVVLPAGKILANYSKLSFDIYLNNITGTDNGYKNIEIWVDNTKIFDVSNGAGTANAWVTKEYTLDNLAGANAFVLDFGLNTNKANYYIDNVKLTEKLSTDLRNSNKNSFQVYCVDNTIQLGQLVSQADVYNLEGRLLVSAKNTSVVNVSNLGRGIYIVKAFVNGQTYMSKITK